jgi:TolB-like protein/Tfp pilus assembly protein PilF
MDVLASIFNWLREEEAGFSAIAAILAIAVIVVTGLRFLLGRRSQPIKETAQAISEDDPLLVLPTGPVVAVLPFENLSRDPDQEYFSDGLTDDIITELSRFKDLFVIARNSTFRYKGQAVDVRQLNKELGARYVLEGSVQRAGNTLRVTAQLLDAKDGTHLWAETYDRELSAANIFALQDEITDEVVGTIASIHGVISRARVAEVKAKPTDSLDAYESVLRATAYWRDNAIPAEHAKVRDALERAVQSDPGYADAWGWLAIIYVDEYRHNYNPRPHPLDRALGAARRAVAADPTSQGARNALAVAYFFRREFDAFLGEAERVIALNPNDTTLLAVIGEMLCNVRDERGIALLPRAMKLDPFHPTWFHFPVAIHHLKRGALEEALAAARKIDMPGFAPPQLLLAVIYTELGRPNEARSTVEGLLTFRPDFTTEEAMDVMRKSNFSEEDIRRVAAALRNAGLPE